MKLAKKSDAVEFANNEKCIGLEYLLNEPNLDISIIELKGRYPDKNFVKNEISQELVYVISGAGKIVKKDAETLEFEAGDVIFIDKQEIYYWDAQAKIAAICAPAWTPEQHKEEK